MRLTNRLTAVILPMAILGLVPAFANPLALDADVAEATYDSTLVDFVSDVDVEVGGWIEANERVGEIGGWRTYLRQAQEPVSDQAEPANTDSQGHTMPGMNHSPSKGKQ